MPNHYSDNLTRREEIQGSDLAHFLKDGKVHIFWEGHKILPNLHLTFDYSTYSQKLGEDFAKFCGLPRIFEL